MATMRTGDVIVNAHCLANSNCDSLFPAVEVCQAWHERAGIELVDLLFKQPDAHHLPVRVQPLLVVGSDIGLRFGNHRVHCFFPPVVTGVDTPDIAARTSNMHAKSYFVQPMPRAAVRNSLLTAVVGKGTSSWRPSSMASTMSFCIMLTSNQASSGCSRT